MNHKPKALIMVFILIICIFCGYFWQRTANTNHDAATSSRYIPEDTASGDTNNDLLRSVMARQELAEKQNKELQEHVEYLKRERKESDNKHESIIKELRNYANEIQNKFSEAPKFLSKSISLYSEYDDNYNNSSPKGSVITEVTDLSSSPIIQKLNTSLPGFDDELPSSKSNWSDNNLNKANSAKPYITIPKLSTLSDVKLMTSIIAEVPVGGKLLSPAYPFKAIIGKKDLIAANGINIPVEASGIVIEGYSVGNMALSCARGYITSLLFVFEDGHFVSYPTENEATATEIYPANSIGYISNEYNAVCIPGQYISNSTSVIGSEGLLGAITSTGKGVAQAQTSTILNGQNYTNVLSKDVGAYAAGNAVSGMSDNVMKYYHERANGITDAVYIPAIVNKKPLTLTVHVTKTINIDYDKNTRTIGHENSNQNIFIAALD